MKVTGFTRFLIVMIFVAPLAYVGASYYNGQDGIQNLKNLFGRGGGPDKTESTSTEPAPSGEVGSASVQSLQDDNQKLREELDFKSKRVDELYRENEELKRKLKSLEETLATKQ